MVEVYSTGVGVAVFAFLWGIRSQKPPEVKQTGGSPVLWLDPTAAEEAQCESLVTLAVDSSRPSAWVVAFALFGVCF